ncbi:MAG: hypothetical protein REI94_01950 [Moraxellaceae bacterium]|nr:hypothetical protein [Moraxellaceae bacterium]
MFSTAYRILLPLALLIGLSGCELLGIEDPAKEAARVEAEGKAIGSACRHSGRALEDCFTMNPSASKSAVFAGWREMNDYMTENKIESIRPELPGAGMPLRKQAAKAAEAEPEEEASEPAASEPASRRRPRRTGGS